MKNRFPKQYEHLDAAESVFFTRELETILTTQFTERLAPLKGVTMVPVDTSISPEDEIVTYREYKSFGKAKKLQDAGDDVPLANTQGTETSQRMQIYGAGFGYSIDEIRKSAKEGRPLEQARAAAAKKMLDLQLDDVASIGDSSAGLKGLLNLTSTNTYTVPADGTGSSALWSAKSADLILRDMNGIVKKVVVDSLETERPTRVVLPTSQYELIKTTARSSTSDTTILKFFLENNPGIEVLSWQRAAGAGSGATDRMVAYDPNVLNLRLLLSVGFEALPPQQRNFFYKINCRMKTGGVIAPYPKSICFGDGI
jgi:hypothetical protein